MAYRFKLNLSLALLTILGLSACARQSEINLAMAGRGYVPAGAKCFQIASGIEKQQKTAERARTQAELFKVDARAGNAKAAKKARRYEKRAKQTEAQAVFNTMLLRGGGGPC